MTLIVEDGNGLSDANAYVAVADVDAYATALGNKTWATAQNADKESAIIRATRYIDGAYRSRFPGYQAKGRDQRLEWPRYDATIPGYAGLQYYTLPNDQVPREIQDATCDAALREFIKPGALAPDLKQGGQITSITAGSVSVDFAGGLTGQNTFQGLDMLLAPILSPGYSFGGKVARC